MKAIRRSSVGNHCEPVTADTQDFLRVLGGVSGNRDDVPSPPGSCSVAVPYHPLLGPNVDREQKRNQIVHSHNRRASQAVRHAIKGTVKYLEVVFTDTATKLKTFGDRILRRVNSNSS